MATRAPRRMTIAEFFDWDDGTDTRYELVEGEVIAMAPAMPGHAAIVSNLDRSIGQQLQKPCFALAGAGMYALARELSIEPAAAVLAGIAFAFTPYRAGQLSHLQVLMSGWLPLCLCALHRYIRLGSIRNLIAFVAAFLLQAFSNGYYLFFTALPIALIVSAAAIQPTLPSFRR